MQTVVLAAGEGTRMRPLTETTPKPLLPVGHTSIVEHTLATAIQAGADRIVLVVGYEAERVRESLGNEYQGVPLTYATQDIQSGTADAVREAAEYLEPAPFAVLNGDTLFDLESLQQLYDSGPAVGTFRVDNPSAYGVLELDDDGETVTDVMEKPSNPPSNLINTGAYVFPPEAIGWLNVEKSQRGERELTDVLSKTCAEYAVDPVPFNRWLDIGRPWELLEANEWKLGEISNHHDGDIHQAAVLEGPIHIEEGATVRSGVVLEGPVVVKSGASIGPNAYVRGASVIGQDAKIGHSVEVKNSVIMENVRIGHLSYVGDSIIGSDTNFGAGTTVANLRHDGEPVRMEVTGEVVSTGRRKFGCVCGTRVKTGINTSLNAGVKLGVGHTTTPGETILRNP